MALLARVRILMRVKRTQFRPPPKVDSMVVEIVPKQQTEVGPDFQVCARLTHMLSVTLRGLCVRRTLLVWLSVMLCA